MSSKRSLLCSIQGSRATQGLVMAGFAVLAFLLLPGPLRGLTEGDSENVQRLADPLRVEVVLKQSPVSIAQDRDLRAYSQVAGQERLRGLTKFGLTIESHVDSTAVTMSDGASAFWVSGVSITLNYAWIKVMVAPGDAQRSCTLHALLAHENEHIRKDTAVVSRFADRIRQLDYAAVLPTYKHPWYGVEATAARQRAAERLRTLLQPVLDEMAAERHQAGEALDATEGPLQTGAECPPVPSSVGGN